MAAVALTSNYPAHFRLNITRATQYIFARIQGLTNISLKDRKNAWHILSYALDLDEAWSTVRDLLFVLAPKMEQAGDRADWMVYLERGIEQSQKKVELEAEAELRFHLGVLYRHQAQYSQARREFELSATQFEQSGNLHLKARALNRLAGVARQERKFEEATRLAEMALELVGEAKEEQAYSYLMLGLIAYYQRDWQNAHHLLEKSLALWEQTNNQRMIAWGLNNLGLILQARKRYVEAIRCYEKAINLFETIQDPVHEAAARMNLGNVYLTIERFSEALNLYALANPTFHDTQAWDRLAMINNNKGMAYRKLQNWDKAKQFYRVSIELWQRIGNISELVNVMDGLGLVYLAEARHDKAIATFQDALDWLSKIKDKASHEHLYAIVSTHLREVIVTSSS